MGTAKPLLDVGGQPMLRAVVQSVVPTATRIAVVTRGEIARCLDFSDVPSVVVVLNDDPSGTMIDSVRLGIIALGHPAEPAAGGGYVVLPGDQPGISAGDMQRCLLAFRRHGGIVVAGYGGRHGHPIIFEARLAAVVLSPVCDGGLRCIKDHAAERLRVVPCTSPAVTQDLDTPEDYAAWSD